MPILLPETTQTSIDTLTPRQIASEAMTIAADICIYTNPNLTIEEL